MHLLDNFIFKQLIESLSFITKKRKIKNAKKQNPIQKNQTSSPKKKSHSRMKMGLLYAVKEKLIYYAPSHNLKLFASNARDPCRPHCVCALDKGKNPFAFLLR